MEKKTSTRFREWLVERLSESKFVTYKSDTDEEIAARLGVHIDVLVEAREVFRERTRRQGLPEGQRFGAKVALGPTTMQAFFLEPPEEIYQAWVAMRDARHGNNSSLLRGVVHATLQTTTQPLWLSERKMRGWIWKGQWLGQTDLRAHRFRLACKVNEGAARALELRAIATKCKPSTIVRWGANLFVCGKLQAPVVSTPWDMYKDPERYCTNPRIIP